MTAINASNLEISYSKLAPPVLKEFSLRLAAGEMIGIVGPNGSGKSTLVRALSRALKPEKGVVLLNGLDLYGATSARDAAKGIGVVQQETAIAFDYTVRDVVLMGRSPHIPRRPFAVESEEDLKIADRAMRSAGVEELAGRSMAELSGGERQRVVLARALAQEADVILLDEPTAHLDLKHQRDVLNIVRGLATNDGRAVLAVLHDLNLAAAYCDRLVLLKDGSIVAQGTVADVLTQENVRKAYGANVWVRCHPVTGRPVLVTLPDLPQDVVETGPAVHVICGGGSGTGLFVYLRQRAYRVTSGVLNGGDTDAESAVMLSIPFILEKPFTAISGDSIEQAELLAGSADLIVVTDVPFGPGNLPNLRTVHRMAAEGKPVFLLSEPEISLRDFTSGEAAKLWASMIELGAKTFGSVEELTAALPVDKSLFPGATPVALDWSAPDNP